MNKLGHQTTITPMVHWGAKTLSECPYSVDVLQELAQGVEEADLSAAEQICMVNNNNNNDNNDNDNDKKKK